MTNTLHELLGVDASATPEQLQMAFNKAEQRLLNSGKPEALTELRDIYDVYKILLGRAKLPQFQLAETATAKPQRSLHQTIYQPTVWVCLLSLFSFLAIWNLEIHQVEFSERQITSKELHRKALELQMQEADLGGKQAQLEKKLDELRNLSSGEYYRGSNNQTPTGIHNTPNTSVTFQNQPMLVDDSWQATEKVKELEEEQTKSSLRSSISANNYRKYLIDRSIDAEALAIQREDILLQRIQEQRLNGEDLITRSSPRLDR